MTSQLVKYTLPDFNNITFNGFNYELPSEILELINKLSHEVGSPSYIKTPIFKKRDVKDVNMLNYKKKKTNKNVEILNDDDWDNIRTFQTTKIDQKVGIDVQIDLIRSYLNKMSDKNYIEMKQNITDVLNNLIQDGINETDMVRVGTNIFEIASNNRFYSKLYADLYSELINNYDVMKVLFENSLATYMELFNNIEYVDPSEDYDKFCKINKINENRKSLSTFFVNLMLNSIISKETIINLIIKLLQNIYVLINVENKKNEVDELTENVAILYKKELIQNADYDKIDGMNISEVIDKLAHCKSKNYNSFSNKSIFRFMDMIDM
jgi:hypothetical protein